MEEKFLDNFLGYIILRIWLYRFFEFSLAWSDVDIFKISYVREAGLIFCCLDEYKGF